MKLFVCTDHPIWYPVGGASIVLARDETQAREQISQTKPLARILCDGNY